MAGSKFGQIISFLLLALPKEAHFVSLKDELFTEQSGVTKQTHKIGVPCMLITKISFSARTSTHIDYGSVGKSAGDLENYQK